MGEAKTETVRAPELRITRGSGINKRLPYMYINGTLLVVKKAKYSAGTRNRPEALEKQGKRIPAMFFKTEASGEPIRE